MDPVMLAHERDSAWALMLHHQRSAERAKKDEKQTRQALIRTQPVTQAMYSISNLISRMQGTPTHVSEAEFVRLVIEYVVGANHKVQQLTDEQKEKNEDG